MKKIVLNAIPIVFILAVIVLILYATGLFGIKPSNPVLTVGIWAIGIAYALTLVFSLAILLMEKGNPVKTLSWMVILLVLPGLGMMLYNFFGANFREEGTVDDEKTPTLKLADKYQEMIAESIGYSKDDFCKEALQDENIHQAVRKNILYLQNDPMALFTKNNRLKLLIDGKETYDALFEALESAREFIHMEYFIWTDDELGQRLKDLLIRMRNSGVKVRIIIDGVGSRNLSSKYIRDLKDNDVELQAFRPLKFGLLNSHSNFRNHRKIVVIDGKVGFTGGINIDGKYLKDDTPLGHWRDTHLRLEGDAVMGLQMIFLLDWHFLTGEKLLDKALFRSSTFENKKHVHIVASDHQTEWDGIKQAYLHAFYFSQKYLYMITPYFAPNDNMINGIRTAAQTGIDVRLIVPAEGDSTITQLATMSFVEELLGCGVRIYQYDEGFIHSKIMICDDVVGTVGSANLDLRSMDQNMEINAFFYDKGTIGDLKELFLTDLKNSKEITLKHFEKNSLKRQILLAVCRLFSPLL